MPNWKKVIVSGSDAELNSLNVTNAITASTFSGSFEGDGSGITGVISSSHALTASFALNAEGGGFPFSGAAVITGSLLVSQSFVDFTDSTGVSGSFSGSFRGDGSGLTGIDVPQVATVTASFTATSSITINHNFNSQNILVSVYDTSNDQIIPQTTNLVDNDNVRVDFANTSSGFVVVAKGGHIVSGSVLVPQVSTVADSFTSSLSHTTTHNFGTKNVIVSVYTGSDEVIIPSSITTTNTSSVTITFPEATTGRVVVVKAGHIVSGSAYDSDRLNGQPGSYYLDWDNFTNVPSGLLSSSAQIASDISGAFGSVSSSLATRIFDNSSSIASLEAASSSYADSASFASDISENSSSIASLNAASSSYLLNTTDTLTGDLTVTGEITAQTLHVQEITSSIVYSSGSNIFGNLQSDTQKFTGSVLVTGSVTAVSFNGIFEGALSSSAQIASDISGAFDSVSSSLASRVTDLEDFSSSLDNNFVSETEFTAYTASANTGSFTGSFTGDGSELTGLVSASHAVTSSYALTASYAESGTGFPFSGSAIITGSLLVSQSSVDFRDATGVSGSFSGSFEGDGSGLTGLVSASHAITSSYALTASYAESGTGFPFSGSAIITGSLLVSQSVVDFTDATAISGSSFSGSFFGDGTGLSGLGYGDTKKLDQTTPATTWSFSHNMNEQYPTVTVYNASNDVIQPSRIEAQDAQTLKLYFGSATAGTAVAVVGGVATTQEAGFNRVFTQSSTATTWSFEHNLGNRYPQLSVFDSSGELVTPGRVETIDQNNLNIYFDTGQSGTATATVGGTSLTASYAESLTVNGTSLTTGENTDVDTGTETITSVSTLFYDGAFFDYIAQDGTNYRAGTVMSVWSSSTVQYNDNSTADIGDTSGVTMSVDISGTDARLRATVTSDNWNIKAFTRAL